MADPKSYECGINGLQFQVEKTERNLEVELQAETDENEDIEDDHHHHHNDIVNCEKALNSLTSDSSIFSEARTMSISTDIVDHKSHGSSFLCYSPHPSGGTSAAADTTTSPSATTTNNICDDKYYGLEAIDRASHNLYPESCNPHLISSPAIKMWEGGSHPLDYIKVYFNPGDPNHMIQPHWHFITCGLTDLYGDDRVHCFNGRHEDSGYGFELTFRVKADDNEPPEWPVALLNNLASYVFNTDIILREFDHIPWHGSLDCELQDNINKTRKLDSGESEMRNMVIVEDPQLPCLDTPHGRMTFLQIVGIMESEFVFARSWRSRAIVDKLLDHPQVGPMLVTNISRKESIFDLDANILQEFHKKVEEEGTNLGLVTAYVKWSTPKEQNVGIESLGLMNDAGSCDLFDEDVPYCEVKSAFIHFDPGAAELLPIMVRGRLMHGSSFTFCSPGGRPDNNLQAVQFVPEEEEEVEEGRFADSSHPMITGGGLLQIFCTHDFIREMFHHFSALESITQSKEQLPLEFKFSGLELTITVCRFPMLDNAPESTSNFDKDCTLLNGATETPQG